MIRERPPKKVHASKVGQRGAKPLNSSEVQEVFTLRSQGLSINNIAQQTKHSRFTISKYLREHVPPHPETPIDGSVQKLREKMMTVTSFDLKQSLLADLVLIDAYRDKVSHDVAVGNLPVGSSAGELKSLIEAKILIAKLPSKGGGSMGKAPEPHAPSISKLLTSVRSPDGKLYARSLDQSLSLLEGVLHRAAEEFDRTTQQGDFETADELSRIMLHTSAALREITLEMQHRPNDDEEFSWPLTKGFWPYPYQRDFIFDLPSTTGKRLFGFIGGIRSGKTRCGCEKLLLLASMNRGRQGAVFGPTYRMLEDATKKTLFKVLDAKGVPFKYRASDNSITLFGDTLVSFRSLDTFDHLRGTELAFWLADEIGQMPDSSAFDVILGRLSDPAGREVCGLVATTPDGMNWLHGVLVDRADEYRAKVYYARTEDNAALSRDFVDSLRSSYDPRFAQQELQGKFLNVFSGQAYWNFDRQQNVAAGAAYDPTLRLGVCFDLNVEPMCWNMFQTFAWSRHPVDVVVDELHMKGAGVQAALDEVCARYAGHRAGVDVYGDAASQHRNSSATRTDYDVIRARLEASFPDVTVNVGRSNPAVTDRISAVNARLLNDKGDRRLLVSDRCRETLADFERCGLIPGSRQLDKSDPERTHHTDAVGYWVFKCHPLRDVRVTTY